MVFVVVVMMMFVMVMMMVASALYVPLCRRVRVELTEL